jgi:hypothetical protein
MNMGFVKGTQVLSNEGYKNIEDVTMGMKLATHIGNLPVHNIQRKQYTGTLYVLLYNANETVVCTDEHPFYVRTYSGNYIFGEPIWKAAKDLKMNDFCGMITNRQISENNIQSTTVPSKKGLCLCEKRIIATVDENGMRFESDCEYTWHEPISFSTYHVENEEVYNLELENENSYIVDHIIVR